MGHITEEIRPTREGDLPELRNLFEITIADAFEKNGIRATGEFSGEVGEKMGLLRSHFDRALQGSRFWTAERGGCILGIIGHFRPANPDIRSRLPLDFSRVPEIGCVYVVPDAQGQGLGRLLLITAVLSLRSAGVESFCLDCGYPRSQHAWRALLGEPCFVEANRWASGQHYMIWVNTTAEVSLRLELPAR